MNLVDMLIVAAGGFAALGGFYYGFVARALSWLGLALGVVVSAWLLPPILRAAGGGGAATRLFVTIVVLLVGASLGGSLGQAVGTTLRRAIPPGPARTADRAGGAVAGVAGMLVLLWFVLPVASDVPGGIAREVRQSAIASVLAENTPAPPGPVQALKALVGDDRFPDVFEGISPAPETGTPPEQLPLSEEVLARVTASTVNVESAACQVQHEGSGFAVAANTVVTNAHVVAGTDDLQVRRPDGRVRSARVVTFDDDRDLAVLEVDDLGQEPLPIADGAAGQEGAVIGYPMGQNEPRPQSAAIDSQRTAVGRDIYGRDRVERDIFILAARLERGDSGGPLVNPDGAVVGVAFAIAPDRPDTAYALTSGELRTVLDGPRNQDAGPCM